MDPYSQSSPEIQRLIQLSEASRSVLTREVATLRHKLDVPTRFRTSIKEHPSRWLFSSLGTGFFTSFLFRRKKAAAPTVVSTAKKSGILLTILGLAFTGIQPLVKLWLADYIKGYLSSPRFAATLQRVRR